MEKVGQQAGYSKVREEAKSIHPVTGLKRTDHPFWNDDVHLLHRKPDVFYAAFDQGDFIF